jgi:hypothetical protein
LDGLASTIFGPNSRNSIGEIPVLGQPPFLRCHRPIKPSIIRQFEENSAMGGHDFSKVEACKLLFRLHLQKMLNHHY